MRRLSSVQASSPHHDCGDAGRRAFLRTAAIGGIALSSSQLPSPHKAVADADSSELIFRGVLQVEKKDLMLSEGTTATVALRVVGRNTKGPIASVVVPVGGAAFPIEFAVKRSDLRENLPEFIWLEDDIYLKADVTSASGKNLLVGRSKSKAVAEDGRPSHGTAYVTLEPQ